MPELTTEQVMLYILVTIISGGGIVGFYTKIWFPHKQKLQEAAAAAAENQRKHERSMAERQWQAEQEQRAHERKVAELQAQSQTTTQQDQQEHLQRTQSDALQALLGISGRLIDNAIQSSQGTLQEQLRLLAVMSQTMGKLEAMLSTHNRDWSRQTEVVSDIDTHLAALEGMLKALLAKEGINMYPELELEVVKSSIVTIQRMLREQGISNVATTPIHDSLKTQELLVPGDLPANDTSASDDKKTP